MSEKIVGIIGGMGPEATIDLMNRVLRATPAADDRDHIRMVVDNNPKVPSRIEAIIEGTGESPVSCLREMAKKLAALTVTSHQTMRKASRCGIKAYEQLAIYYEHNARHLQKAASITHEALVKLQEAFHAGHLPALRYRQWHESLQHRLNRLRGKIAKS